MNYACHMYPASLIVLLVLISSLSVVAAYSRKTNRSAFIVLPLTGTTKTLSECRALCASWRHGAYVAVILNSEDNEAVKRQASAFNEVLLGATRSESTYTFRWTEGPFSGSAFWTTNTDYKGGVCLDGAFCSFCSGEPNNLVLNEELVGMWGGTLFTVGATTGCWNDEQANKEAIDGCACRWDATLSASASSAVSATSTCSRQSSRSITTSESVTLSQSNTATNSETRSIITATSLSESVTTSVSSSMCSSSLSLSATASSLLSSITTSQSATTSVRSSHTLSSSLSPSRSQSASLTRSARTWSATHTRTQSPTSMSPLPATSPTRSNTSEAAMTLAASLSLHLSINLRSPTISSSSSPSRKSRSASTTKSPSAAEPVFDTPRRDSSEVSRLVSPILSVATVVSGDVGVVTTIVFLGALSCRDTNENLSGIGAYIISLFYYTGNEWIAWGNILVAVGVVLLHLSAAMVVKVAKRVSDSTQMRAAVRFPALSIQAADVLLPGAVYGGTRLMLSSDSSSLNVLLGAAAVVVAFATIAVCFAVAARYCVPRSVWEVYRLPPQVTSQWDSRWYPTGRWAPLELRRSFAPLLSSMNFEHGGLASIQRLVALVLSLAAGLRESKTACEAMALLLAVVSGAAAAVFLWLRCLRDPLSRGVVPLAYAVFSAVCVLKFLSSRSPSDDRLDASIDTLQLMYSSLHLSRALWALWMSYRESQWDAYIKTSSAGSALCENLVTTAEAFVNPEDVLMNELVITQVSKPAEESEKWAFENL